LLISFRNADPAFSEILGNGSIASVRSGAKQLCLAIFATTGSMPPTHGNLYL
jgi:hypothetical protein